MGRIETVKIVADNESGFVIINKSDMTDDHKIYVEKQTANKPSASAKKTGKES